MIELDVVNTNFKSDRTDRWWLQPTIFGATFIVFALYSIIVVSFDFDNGFYSNGGTHYKSPFYGPEPWFEWSNPVFLGITFGYAFFTLWAPFGFRGTCYYMRRVYYRSIFPLVSSQGPPACAVDGLKAFKGKYKGETSFPWILNNFHRYFLYATVLLGLYHWYEFFLTLNHDGSLGFGLGSIFAFMDAFFLTLYITSCHAFRHLLGGSVDRQGSLTNRIWTRISKWNTKHGLWFWLSMASIFIWDVYIRMLNYYDISWSFA